MKPREPTVTGQQDLFRSRLAQIIDMRHEFVVVAGHVVRDCLAETSGRDYSDRPGHPALSTRLMAGLHILRFAGITRDGEVVPM